MPKSPEDRQAKALEDIAKSLRDLDHTHGFLNDNIAHIARFIITRKKPTTVISSPEPLEAPEVIEAKTRIPVRTFPSADDKTPVGWAEIDSNGWVDIQIPGANLVNDLEFLTEIGRIKSLYLSVEIQATKPVSDGGDTNAAE